MAAKGAALPEDRRVLRAGQAVGARHPAVQGAVAPLREESLRLRKAERNPQERSRTFREGHLVLRGGSEARPRIFQGRVLREIVCPLSQGMSSLKHLGF